MHRLIERAEDLAALCIPPAAGIIRELIAKIEDQRSEIESMHRCFATADRERSDLRAKLGIAHHKLEKCLECRAKETA